MSTAGLVQPTSLAVAPDGDLLIADDGRNQILRRAPNGQLSVVAGNGTAGYGGDDGPATDAELNGPQDMVVAPDGTVYFVDFSNYRVRAISPAGVITTVAGNGSEEFNGNEPITTTDDVAATSEGLDPRYVAIGPDGALYIADVGRIRRVSSGVITTIAGNGTTGEAGDGGPAVEAAVDPSAIAFDGSGDLFLYYFPEKGLRVIASNGIISSVPGSAGTFYGADTDAIVEAPSGTVYGAARWHGLSRITRSGVQPILSLDPVQIPAFQGLEPDGLAIGPDGTIYFDSNSNGVGSVKAIAALAPGGQGGLLTTADTSG